MLIRGQKAKHYYGDTGRYHIGVGVIWSKGDFLSSNYFTKKSYQKVLMNKCPKCESTYVYLDGSLWNCPECAYEWSQNEPDVLVTENSYIDANKQILTDGDTVVLVKDLKVKGASGSLKKGTKVKNIRLVEPVDGHNISCKIEGFGAMNLKSEFVKKV